MASAYATYKMFVDMKLHFTDDDFIYGQSSSNANEATFAKRRDRYAFEKLGSRYGLEQMREFMIATFLENSDLSVWDLLKPEAEACYVQWRRRIESLTYCFNSDCADILAWLESETLMFNDLFANTDGKLPILVEMAIHRVIDIETLVIFDKLLGFMQRIAKDMRGADWVRINRTVAKYSYFVACDVSQFKRTLKNKIDTEYPVLRESCRAT